MKNILNYSFLFIFLLLVGCKLKDSEDKIPSIFNTKIEAEQAAKNFNCTGAHKMGNKWMPCKSHKNHESYNKKSKSHKDNHN